MLQPSLKFYTKIVGIYHWTRGTLDWRYGPVTILGDIETDHDNEAVYLQPIFFYTLQQAISIKLNTVYLLS